MEIARRESELAEMKLLESTLTEKWKDKVKLVEYGDDKCINDECPVCLTEFVKESLIWKLSCGHGGCASRDCQFKRLLVGNDLIKCPLCRTDHSCEVVTSTQTEVASSGPAPPLVRVQIDGARGARAFENETDARNFFRQWGETETVQIQYTTSHTTCLVQYSNSLSAKTAKFHITHGVQHRGVRVKHERCSLFELDEDGAAELHRQALTLLIEKRRSMRIGELVRDLDVAFSTLHRLHMDEEVVINFLNAHAGFRVFTDALGSASVCLSTDHDPADAFLRLWVGCGLGEQAFHDFGEALSFFQSFGSLVAMSYKQYARNSIAFVTFKTKDTARRFFEMEHTINGVLLNVKLIDVNRQAVPRAPRAVAPSQSTAGAASRLQLAAASRRAPGTAPRPPQTASAALGAPRPPPTATSAALGAAPRPPPTATSAALGAAPRPPSTVPSAALGAAPRPPSTVPSAAARAPPLARLPPAPSAAAQAPPLALPPGLVEDQPNLALRLQLPPEVARFAVAAAGVELPCAELEQILFQFKMSLEQLRARHG